MTKREWNKLSETDKLKKVAEHAGWKKIRSPEGRMEIEFCNHYGGFMVGENIYNPKMFVVPDYLNDLNAMHEAENCLSNKPLDGDNYKRGSLYIEMIHPLASARERAEAFVIAMEKEDE